MTPNAPFRPSLKLGGLLFMLLGAAALSAAAPAAGSAPFPTPLEVYTARETAGAPLLEVLKQRVQADPFNLVATLLFVGAILHTFVAPKIMHLAHHYKHEHEEAIRRLRQSRAPRPGEKDPVSFKAEILHFLGEVEVVFGLWVIPLLLAITLSRGWGTAVDYLSHGVNFTEPIFVVIIMAVAASRPILRLAEQMLGKLASLGGSTPAAWWVTLLTAGPILGSFITEPAAMTIAALLLLQNFYRCNPSNALRYATLGLLFVNVSVGGTLTHFAAPPVLMVAGKWGWGLAHMLEHFGWKAIAGILTANATYFLYFRREFASLKAQSVAGTEEDVDDFHWPSRRDAIPVWITIIHLVVLAWTVFTAHYTVLGLGGFLIFLGFTYATAHHQNPISLRTPVLVGFFLAGLVVHGSLQQWWIEPVLTRLSAVPLMLGATVLTAFNDNAAITYLASLVPGFSDELKYAVVAGAVAGGGLTVIANAPNPAGQAILGSAFKGGIAPGKLALAALLPTLIMVAAFLLLPS